MEIDREELLMKLGGARALAPAAWRLIDVEVDSKGATFSFALNRKKCIRREGLYLLRTNLRGEDPAELWQFYIQLVEVEALRYLAYRHILMATIRSATKSLKERRGQFSNTFYQLRPASSASLQLLLQLSKACPQALP